MERLRPLPGRLRQAPDEDGADLPGSAADPMPGQTIPGDHLDRQVRGMEESAQKENTPTFFPHPEAEPEAPGEVTSETAQHRKNRCLVG